MKNAINRKQLLTGFIFGVLLLSLLTGIASFFKEGPSQKGLLVPSVTQQQNAETSIFYKGKEGVDALTLLKEQASIEVEKSGLVSSINGRKADAKKREYWAFYVNGKLASVGPAEYVTKDGDRIEWRIDHY